VKKILPIVTALVFASVIFGQSTDAKLNDKGEITISAPTPTPTPESDPAFRLQADKPRPAVEFSFDRFKGLTIAKSVEMPLISQGRFSGLYGNSISAQIEFGFFGRALMTEVNEFTLCFKSESRDWRFLEGSRLILIADNLRLESAKGERDDYISMYSPGVTEWIRYKLTRRQLENISNAKKVEFQIETFESALTKEDQNILTIVLMLSRPGADEGKNVQPPMKPISKTISGGILNGRAISLPDPRYPAAAKAVQASGSVSVQVLIDETGRVISASAVSGHPLLRSSAEWAAKEARFPPTLLDGVPVKVSGIVTYSFVP
jgi:TonB family protein